MTIIWYLIKASWVNVAIAILAGLISGGSSAALIALINQALNQNSPQSLVAPFVGLACLSVITGAVSSFLLVDLAQDAVYRLRLQLSERILSAPLQQLEALGPSQLLASLTEDVQAISNTVFIIPFLCVDIAVVAGCLIYMSLLSGKAFLAVAVFLIVAVIAVQIIANYAYRYLALARKEIDRLLKDFQGITEGTKELKLHTTRRQLFLEEDLKVNAISSRDYTKTALKLAAFANNSGQLLFFILIGLLLFLSPRLIANTQSFLPAYILTMTYVLGPIEGVIQRLPNLMSANVSIQKVSEMGLALSEKAEISSATRQHSTQSFQSLSLTAVVHTYRTRDSEQQFTFGPIDLTINSGELIFIVGGNGSGKSTLAKIMTGLYSPDAGNLQLNGQPITSANLDWYRQHFSVVFSDFYLFNRLISDEALTMEAKTQMYLEKLQLEKKVSVQNNQLSTTALSQGQRKRLALLAAYLEDRPIYLFDEWAADQDPIFREIFYTQLLAELKTRGKTILVISHDDQYFYLADRVIKLNYGQIEMGK